MPQPDDYGFLTDEDYHLVVTDGRGVPYDLGPLVTALLSVHRHHPISIESSIHLDEPDRQLVVATAEAGLEAGIKLSVVKLFGHQAAQDFSEHCDQLMRDLDASDLAAREERRARRKGDGRA